MKKIVVLFLISHLALLISASPVNAHVLKTDGSVGAILHVSPDDSPIAGALTDFFFELKDLDGKFKPENCNCVAQVLRGGDVLIDQPLFALNPSPTLDNASFRYTLPQKGVYTIRLTGEPKTEGSFERFVLSWDIRVDREATDNPPQNSTNWLAELAPYILGIGLFFLVLITLQKKGGAKKK